MTPVTIGFSTSPALISRIIRAATRAKVSHTFLVVDVFGKPTVLEEADDGLRMTTLERFKDRATIVAMIQLPSCPGDSAALQQLHQHLGERYDWTGLFGMAWVMLKRWLGRKVRNPLASSHSMFCSEANARFLQWAGYPGAMTLDPASTSPQDLMAFLVKSKS